MLSCRRKRRGGVQDLIQQEHMKFRPSLTLGIRRFNVETLLTHRLAAPDNITDV